jgi:hypothetical protein
MAFVANVRLLDVAIGASRGHIRHQLLNGFDALGSLLGVPGALDVNGPTLRRRLSQNPIDF